MKRFFAILLMCLLPLHVLAKVTHTGIASEKTVMQVSESAAESVHIHHILFYGDSSQEGSSSDVSYFGAFDEPVTHSALVFKPNTLISYCVGQSDRALRPPFLSPDGRPPRV